MTHALRVLVAAAGIIALGAVSASPQGERWSDLARRIAVTDPYAPFEVTLGAEPPHFTFPLPVRPALLLLGSAWFSPKPNAQPVVADLYYAPASHTGTASEALYAALTAAGYTRPKRQEPYPNARAGDYGPTQHFCPANPRGAAVDVYVDTVDGLPAMDVRIIADAASTACGSGPASGADSGVRGPDFNAIPGMTYHARSVLTPGLQSALNSTGTVETALPPAEAAAKIAKRFTAKGWTARPPIATPQTIVQRFAHVAAAYRYDALVVFDRRGDGVYDLLVELTGDVVSPAGS